MKPDARPFEHIFGNRRAEDGSLVADNFARWFGASKIVDGAPRMLFHATPRDFTEFRSSYSGFYGEGVYLLEDAAACDDYLEGASGDLVMPVFARMTNPFVFDAPPAEKEPSNFTLARALFKGADLRAVLRELKDCGFDNPGGDLFRWRLEELGHDGLIVRPVGDPVEYIVFEASALKSAIGNSGLFVEGSSDITDRQPRPALRERMRA